MAKKREAFDNGFLVIEKETTNNTTATNDETIMSMATDISGATIQKSISLLDYLDTALSYLTDPVQVIAVDKTQKGTCLLCGAETNKPERKICINCFKTYKSDIYESYKDIKLNGSDTIEW